MKLQKMTNIISAAFHSWLNRYIYFKPIYGLKKDFNLLIGSLIVVNIHVFFIFIETIKTQHYIVMYYEKSI